MTDPTPAGPLSGYRIIDMTTVLAGPFATQIAGDYGADVIKVEPPEGDVMRLGGAKRHEQMGPLYLHANRNKRSVVLDVKQPAARDAVLRLARGADAFVHNIRPAAMARLGLAYDDLKAVNPGIVYVNLVGYGHKGPYAGKPAYDDLIQGVGGIAGAFTLVEGQEPRFVPAVIADRLSGLNAAHALIAALLHRERTGQGQMVEVPMFESVAQVMLGDNLGGLSFDPPAGPPGYNRLTTPNRRPYKTRDGYICVLIYTDRHWQNFFKAIGRPEIWRDDPRFADQATRTRHYDEAYGMVAGFLLERGTDEWLELLTANDLPAVPMSRIEDLQHDPHLLQSGMLETIDHPTEGRIRQIRSPAYFSASPTSIRHPAPNPGEQTTQVLAEAGYPEHEIRALLDSGAAHQFSLPTTPAAPSSEPPREEH